MGLDALKARKRRTTEKLLQKLGQSDDTARKADDLSALHNDFNENHKQMLLLLSKFQLYVDSLEKWQRCGEALSAEVSRFVRKSGAEKDEGGNETESRAALDELSCCFASTQSEIATICSDMVDTWSMQILAPLRDVALTFDADISKKLNQRALDKLDFDAYRRRVKNTPSSGKQAAAAQRNSTKLAMTRDRYEANNAYLLAELTRLKTCRSELVVDELALAVCSQQQFINSLQKAYIEGFGEALDKHLPSDDSVENLLSVIEHGDHHDSGASGVASTAIVRPQLRCGKRQNRWLRNGPSTTRITAGYEAKSFKVSPARALPREQSQDATTTSAALSKSFGTGSPQACTGSSTSSCKPSRTLDINTSLDSERSDADSACSPCSHCSASGTRSPSLAPPATALRSPTGGMPVAPASPARGPRPRLDRSQSTRHYVRNAKRGKNTLKAIGKQISLNGMDIISRKKTNTLTADFVLPPPATAAPDSGNNLDHGELQVKEDDKKEDSGLKEEPNQVEKQEPVTTSTGDQVEPIESTQPEASTADSSSQISNKLDTVSKLDQDQCQKTTLTQAGNDDDDGGKSETCEKSDSINRCFSDRTILGWADSEDVQGSEEELESEPALSEQAQEFAAPVAENESDLRDPKMLLHVMDVDAEIQKGHPLDKPTTPCEMTQTHTTSSAA